MLVGLGSNGSGQLGLGHEEDISAPSQVVEGIDVSAKTAFSGDVKDIAAGGNHTVVLCHDGSAWAAGNNEDGRCNLQATSSWSSMQKGERSSFNGQSFYGVAATWSATIFSANYGTEIWSCGTGESGELGLRKDVRQQTSMKRIENFPPEHTRVVQLAACMAHVVAVLSNGEVYGWGKARKGQLGEPAENSVWTPRKIEGIPFAVAKAACGKDFTCVVGGTQTGELMVLGPNSNDRFGIRTQAPDRIPGWSDIRASWGSIFILTDTCKILAWGRNDHGQLPPPDAPLTAAMIAAGSEHCLALTTAKEVVAWGWGEHGNCGEPTDEKGDVKARFNVLKVSRAPTRIFAGCATSFVQTADG